MSPTCSERASCATGSVASAGAGSSSEAWARDWAMALADRAAAVPKWRSGKAGRNMEGSEGRSVARERRIAQLGRSWNRFGRWLVRAAGQYRGAIPGPPSTESPIQVRAAVMAVRDNRGAGSRALTGGNENLQFHCRFVLIVTREWTKKRGWPPDSGRVAPEGACLQPACKASLVVGFAMISSN